MRSLCRLLALSLLVPLLSACVDPEHDSQVDDLGPEVEGVPAGPLHRPGQPCLTCHGKEGPADQEFSIAGTVYYEQKSTQPMPNVLVHVIDWQHNESVMATNCAGNFWVQPGDYTPLQPYATWLEYAGQHSSMTSLSFREGSCAFCHRDPAGPSSVGHIFFRSDIGQPVPLPGGCP